MPSSQPRDSRGPNRTRGTLTTCLLMTGRLSPGGSALGGAGSADGVVSGSTWPVITNGGAGSGSWGRCWPAGPVGRDRDGHRSGVAAGTSGLIGGGGAGERFGAEPAAGVP